MSPRGLFFLAFLLVFLVAMPVMAEEEPPVVVTDIQVAGNKKIEAETIRSRMSTKVGEEFYPSRIRNDIDAIYRMGYFDDVKVEAEGYEGGLRLVFTVVERPVITSFGFEGNKEVEADKIREKVTLAPYSIYNPALVEENAEKIRRFYNSEGYYNAAVLPIVKRSERDVKVIYKIDEGGKVIISDIRLSGNEKMKARRLRKAMATKEYIPLWSWLFKTGTYKADELAIDMERIKAVYYNNGYIQVVVDEPGVALSEDKRKVNITIPIHEGEQFRYRGIDVSGNTVFPKEDILAGMKSKGGEIMDREKLREDIVSLTDLYGAKGYAFATISPVISPDVEKRMVDTTLEISEGPQVYVNRINISGNAKTRDKVIRRELKFDEGGVYDTASLKKSHERLKNLDYFEDIEIVPDRRGEDTVDLAVKVKEKSTGMFSIGGGYSTVDRLVALAEITQNNFLGLGQTLRFKGEMGQRRQNFVLSLTEPWLFDKPISLRGDLFKEERVYNGYSKRSTGGGLSIGRRFMEYWNASANYSYSNDMYFDVIDSIEQSGVFQDTRDIKSIGRLGASLARDTRDNYMDTRRGSNNALYTEVASTMLLGDASFYKVVLDSAWHFPFYWDTSFLARGRFGLAHGFGGKELPLFERFYVGGISTVRGYNWGAIGPKVVMEDEFGFEKETDQPKGGTKEMIFNLEYTFPLVPQIKLRGVTFMDAGAAYDNGQPVEIDDLRYSAGAGFRWISPMGLIRLEYGYVLGKKEGERGSKWEFSMGTLF